ncbi:hypothetical protein GCM10010103_76690 [Streptomyces paradoxus]|uniref:Uncharacterized protein n=1 Tax=Streptomyces paradoxus TaxID=66375 RepID=A0A7W9TI84_9ACTN|nr:hypothetical protein [Streptomyces paradoxus]MBB6081119.1 hypothetical protein [Streptomyces paradoxus]
MPLAGISRAQAYRLLDVARSLAAIHGAVTAGTEASRTRDTGPAAAALDYGLSRRALIAVSGRSGDVAELINRRLATLALSGLQVLDEPTVRAVVLQAVRDIRTAPPPPPADPSADPALATLRRGIDELAASTWAIGELMREVAPAYLSNAEAADLAPLCEEIGEPPRARPRRPPLRDVRRPPRPVRHRPVDHHSRLLLCGVTTSQR